jgi:hypothetical protein
MSPWHHAQTSATQTGNNTSRTKSFVKEYLGIGGSFGGFSYVAAEI